MTLKLNWQEIYKEHKFGYSCQKLADIYGCDSATISKNFKKLGLKIVR